MSSPAPVSPRSPAQYTQYSSGMDIEAQLNRVRSQPNNFPNGDLILFADEQFAMRTSSEISNGVKEQLFFVASAPRDERGFAQIDRFSVSDLDFNDLLNLYYILYSYREDNHQSYIFRHLYALDQLFHEANLDEDEFSELLVERSLPLYSREEYSLLIDWVEEVKDTPEYDARMIAMQRIKATMGKEGDEINLNLQNLSLTSLPSYKVMGTDSKRVLRLTQNQLTPASLNDWIVNLQNVFLVVDPALSNEVNIVNAIYTWVNEVSDPEEKSRRFTFAKTIKHQYYSGETSLDLNFLPVQNTTLQLSPFSSLTHVNMANTQARVFPNVNGLTSLVHLNVSYNSIQTMPGAVNSLVSLRHLDITSNLISELPDLSRLTSLMVFRASDNEISSIPEYFSRLVISADLDFERNHLTERAITLFQTAVNEARAQDPNLGPSFHVTIYTPRREVSLVSYRYMLGGYVLYFLNEIEKRFPEEDYPAVWENRPLNRFPKGGDGYFTHYLPILDHEKGRFLYLFLNEMVQDIEEQDNESLNRNLILRVDRVLDAACQHEEFREQMFLIAEGATSTCGDGRSLALNRMERQMLILCGPSRLDDTGLAKLLVGIHRVDVLERICMQIIETKRVADPTQVYLYYQVKLRDSLKLPLSSEEMLYEEFTENMLYGQMGMAAEPQRQQDLDAVSQQVLAQTSSSDDVERILLRSKEWKQRLRENFAPFINEKLVELGFTTSFEEIETNYRDAFNAAYENENLSAGQLQILTDQIKAQRDYLIRQTEVAKTVVFTDRQLASII